MSKLSVIEIGFALPMHFTDTFFPCHLSLRLWTDAFSRFQLSLLKILLFPAACHHPGARGYCPHNFSKARGRMSIPMSTDGEVSQFQAQTWLTAVTWITESCKIPFFQLYSSPRGAVTDSWGRQC